MDGVLENFSICITDSQLDLPGPTIIYVNNHFLKMTGYEREEVIGKTPRIMQGPETDRQVMQELKRCCIEGKHFEGSTINYRKDGSKFPIAWNVNPIIVFGKIVAYLAVQSDLTGNETVAELIKIRNIANRIRQTQASILSELDKGLFDIGV
jgi:PAS domain S-box-containing protein